jgi:hypothetical protein
MQLTTEKRQRWKKIEAMSELIVRETYWLVEWTREGVGRKPGRKVNGD